MFSRSRAVKLWYLILILARKARYQFESTTQNACRWEDKYVTGSTIFLSLRLRPGDIGNYPERMLGDKSLDIKGGEHFDDLDVVAGTGGLREMSSMFP